MQIETTVRYHLTPVRMAISLTSLQITNAGEGVEKGEPSYPVGGSVSWYNPCGEQYGGPQKIKYKLPYDPASPFLGIYIHKTIIQKDRCTLMFIAELFTTTNT